MQNFYITRRGENGVIEAVKVQGYIIEKEGRSFGVRKEKCWSVTELTTGMLMTGKTFDTKKSAIEYIMNEIDCTKVKERLRSNTLNVCIRAINKAKENNNE